jgi:hypothetical protein
VQRRLLAQCAWLSTGRPEHLARVADIDDWLLEQAKPEIFDDGAPANVLTQHRRRFGQLCAALSEKGYPRPQEMSVFDFNSAVDYLNEKHKPT